MRQPAVAGGAHRLCLRAGNAADQGGAARKLDAPPADAFGILLRGGVKADTASGISQHCFIAARPVRLAHQQRVRLVRRRDQHSRLRRAAAQRQPVRRAVSVAVALIRAAPVVLLHAQREPQRKDHAREDERRGGRGRRGAAHARRQAQQRSEPQREQAGEEGRAHDQRCVGRVGRDRKRHFGRMLERERNQRRERCAQRRPGGHHGSGRPRASGCEHSERGSHSRHHNAALERQIGPRGAHRGADGGRRDEPRKHERRGRGARERVAVAARREQLRLQNEERPRSPDADGESSREQREVALREQEANVAHDERASSALHARLRSVRGALAPHGGRGCRRRHGRALAQTQRGGGGDRRAGHQQKQQHARQLRRRANHPRRQQREQHLARNARHRRYGGCHVALRRRKPVHREPRRHVQHQRLREPRNYIGDAADGIRRARRESRQRERGVAHRHGERARRACQQQAGAHAVRVQERHADRGARQVGCKIGHRGAVEGPRALQGEALGREVRHGREADPGAAEEQRVCEEQRQRGVPRRRRRGRQRRQGSDRWRHRCSPQAAERELRLPGHVGCRRVRRLGAQRARRGSCSGGVSRAGGAGCAVALAPAPARRYTQHEQPGVRAPRCACRRAARVRAARSCRAQRLSWHCVTRACRVTRLGARAATGTRAARAAAHALGYDAAGEGGGQKAFSERRVHRSGASQRVPLSLASGRPASKSMKCPQNAFSTSRNCEKPRVQRATRRRTGFPLPSALSSAARIAALRACSSCLACARRAPGYSAADLVKVDRVTAVAMTSAAALGPYARASALRCKVEELLVRGHTERSDDKLREALAAARAVSTEDCLVTAFLTVDLAGRTQLSLMRSMTSKQSAALPDLASFADKLRELDEAVAGAASVARRRRSLDATQPAEQAWYLAHRAAGMCARGLPESEALKEVGHLASLCHETTVYAASEALDVLDVATKLALFSASELCSRLEAACDLVDEAVALAGLQRVQDTYSAYEVPLKSSLPACVELWRQESSTAAHASRLEEALKLLCLHGTLSADDDAQIDQDAEKSYKQRVAARAAATASELRRVCALASCGAKEAHEKHFSRCGACKAVVYCSKDCQLADWPAHKKACKATRKAADEAKTAAAGNAN